MRHEFHAQFPFALQDSVTQAFAIPWLVDQEERLPARWRDIAIIQDPWVRVNLLAQAIATGRKGEARMGTRRIAGGYWFWLQQRSSEFLNQQLNLMSRLGLITTLPDPSLLSASSWAIHVPFTLRKPYLSRDDTDFHILDNPVKKEWIFKVPYMSSSQWKGALRAAMVRELVQGFQNGLMNEEEFLKKRLQLYRLFGDEKEDIAEYLNRILALCRIDFPSSEGDKVIDKKWEKKFRDALDSVAEEFENLLRKKPHRIGNIEEFQGYLRFYPTFFNRIGLEVINPHDRETGTGKQPIYLECVPAGTTGVFTLLYAPLDEDGVSEGDLKAVAQGIRAMFTRYGFGAKTSSGYGVTEVKPNPQNVRPENPIFQRIWMDVWEVDHA